MKHCLLICLPVLLLSLSHPTANAYQPEYMYPFNGYYLNLENLERTEANGTLARTFKTESKYACRFSNPIWFKGYPSDVIYHNRAFHLTADHQIIITDPGTKKEITIENKEKEISLDFVSGNSFLVSIPTGVLHVKRLEGEHGYIVRLYNMNGEEIYHVQMEHTSLQDGVSSPYLGYLMHTDKHMVFTNSWSYDKQPMTKVVDLTTGNISVFKMSAAGVVRSQDEQNIIGLTEVNEKEKQFTIHMQDKEWSAPMEHTFLEEAQTLVADTILVVANYCRIATGSTLSAYHLYTGEFLWKADVQQLNVGHSKYYNSVLLSLHENKVIMEGIEAFGQYLQVFDLYTGKRLYTDGDFR